MPPGGPAPAQSCGYTWKNPGEREGGGDDVVVGEGVRGAKARVRASLVTFRLNGYLEFFF